MDCIVYAGNKELLQAEQGADRQKPFHRWRAGYKGGGAVDGPQIEKIEAVAGKKGEGQKAMVHQESCETEVLSIQLQGKPGGGCLFHNQRIASSVCRGLDLSQEKSKTGCAGAVFEGRREDEQFASFLAVRITGFFKSAKKT